MLARFIASCANAKTQGMTPVERHPGLLARFSRDVRTHLNYGYLSIRKPSSVLLDGIVVPLSATPQLHAVRRRIYRDSYETPERKAIKHLVKPDDVVLEIGSGLGIVSAVIASRLADSQQLTTVEANPQLVSSIEAGARANGFRYSPMVGAVGMQDGEVTFFVDDSFESSSAIDRGRATTKVRVKQLAFSRLIEDVQPTAIILDVEGAEKDLLDEALPLRVRVLCIEFHPHIIGDAPVSSLLSGLLRQGFNLHLDYSSERVLALSRA